MTYREKASQHFQKNLDDRTFKALFGVDPLVLDLLVFKYSLESYATSTEILIFFCWLKCYVTLDVLGCIWHNTRPNILAIIWKMAEIFDLLLDEVLVCVLTLLDSF
jgi:hypothetical protein